MKNRIKYYLSMLDRGRRIFFSKVLFIIFGYSFFFLHEAELFAKGWVVMRELQVMHFFFILFIWFFSFEVSSLYKSHENNNDKK